MWESLETSSEVTDLQEKMNNFFQQNKLVESRLLAMHIRHSCAKWCQVLQLCWTNGHCTSFQPMVFFIDMDWLVKRFQNIWKYFWNT